MMILRQPTWPWHAVFKRRSCEMPFIYQGDQCKTIPISIPIPMAILDHVLGQINLMMLRYWDEMPIAISLLRMPIKLCLT